ncbi:hypothetical protein [Humibacter sp. RRB41]|uniref:hypothetical protein n=1 Tax=Humibacter sp. RRB41 TaxID=2919946 RepID=UPI001FAA56AE|nr:hypothetical protein [Humibacter sp. RRB41]
MIVELDRQETEEEQAARVLAWRAERALTEAPALFEHVRTIALSGHSEAGETLREWAAPLRITAVDDGDERYVRLIEWVQYWAEKLQLDPPATHVTAWANLKRDWQGFKAATTPLGARMLVSLQTSWLLIHDDAIGAHSSVDDYRTDVTEFLWELRQRYPMRARRERPTASRACPACGVEDVFVDWAGEDSTKARVACDECGWEAPAREVARELRRVA